MMQNLKRNWFVSSKLTWGIWQILMQAIENPKILHCNEILFNKVYNVWAKKKYREVLFDGTEYWCNIWQKTDLCFQKWLSPGHVQKSKNWDFNGILLSKVEMYELKIYRGVLCHDNEEWWKIWRGIDLSVQNWHEELDTFWSEHSKIQKICTLIGCFWPKYIILEVKKV